MFPLAPADEPPEKDEIHSLLYELGGRCISRAGFSDDFCVIPTDNFALTMLVGGVGAYFTFDGAGAFGFSIAAGWRVGCGVAADERLGERA